MMTMSIAMSAVARLAVWIITACLALLSGCSAIRFVYNQAPDFAYWWLDGYVDFREDQSPLVRTALADWFKWHRTTQLTDYAALLASAQQQVLADTTPAQVCRWMGDLRRRMDVAYDNGVPALAELVRTMQTEQVQHIERRYRKADQEFRDDFLQATRAERHAAAIKRTASRIETVYGSLDEAQLELVAQSIAASPFDAQVWLAERQARQQVIVATLGTLVSERADAARSQAALRVLAAQASLSPRADYRAYWQQLTDYNCAFVSRLHNTMSLEQRRRGAAKLKSWEDDMRSLAAQRP